MTPQSVFNKLIPAYYRQGTTRRGMCVAVLEAETDGYINHEEAAVALQAIKAYMGEIRHRYLRDVLCAVGLLHDEEALIAIYQDWENRPALLHEDECFD